MLDIWWLVWAIFIVAIIERKNLLDDSKKWFDLFRVLFELVSAFGGVGLSLGFPSVSVRPLLVVHVIGTHLRLVFAQDNFSFSGTMRPLSKLVIIVIMYVIGTDFSKFVNMGTDCISPAQGARPSPRLASRSGPCCAVTKRTDHQ